MLNLFSSLIQQYPSTVVVAAFICGGCLGFFAAALCAVAHNADLRTYDEDQRSRTRP